MYCIEQDERPDWREKAAEAGFNFHTIDGDAYWDETSAYRFTLEQIERDIEEPTNALHAMCRQAVEEIVNSEELMGKLLIPAEHMDLVANSWKAGEPELYGRFDLSYDGNGPASMLEYNADTPTSLFESANFQWQWLEDRQARGYLHGADQFNSIYEALVERLGEIIAPGTDVHFASCAGSDEDLGTVETIAWAARDAGLGAHYTTIESIGLSEDGQFADSESRVIGTLFKLYPWEDMLREEFGGHIANSGCRFIEPAWKAVVSNKGILPVLWKMFEGHRHLLPAFFEDEMQGAAFDRSSHLFAKQGLVRKPIFSREGADITIESRLIQETSPERGYMEHAKIIQLYKPLPVFDRGHAVIGSWVVGETACGIGIREDNSRITQDTSRFKPHFILS